MTVTFCWKRLYASVVLYSFKSVWKLNEPFYWFLKFQPTSWTKTLHLTFLSPIASKSLAQRLYAFINIVGCHGDYCVTCFYRKQNIWKFLLIYGIAEFDRFGCDVKLRKNMFKNICLKSLIYRQIFLSLVNMTRTTRPDCLVILTFSMVHVRKCWSSLFNFDFYLVEKLFRHSVKLIF